MEKIPPFYKKIVGCIFTSSDHTGPKEAPEFASKFPNLLLRS